jgi:hypothetical protein
MTDDHTTDPAATEPTGTDRSAASDPGASTTGADRSDRSSTGTNQSDPSRTGEPGESSDRQTARRRPDDVETSVPADAPVFCCSHCGRPFATEQLLALHRGLAHGGALTPDERAAYESALEAEAADIRRFRILALGALVVLYFGLLFAYAAFA